jgi:hypothetical protein
MSENIGPDGNYRLGFQVKGEITPETIQGAAFQCVVKLQVEALDAWISALVGRNVKITLPKGDAQVVKLNEPADSYAVIADPSQIEPTITLDGFAWSPPKAR